MSLVRLRSVWLLATVFVLAACADSAPSKGGSADAGPDGSISIPTADMAVSAPPTLPPGVAAPSLALVGDANRLLSYNTRTDVSVIYKDGAGSPIPNGTVNANMIDASTGADVTAAGLGGTILEASSGTTDASGTAVFHVSSAGSDATFYVKFSAANVPTEPAVQVKISVSRNGSGNLVVKALYTPHNRQGGGGRYTFREIVSARPSLFNQSCDALLANNTPARLPPAHSQLNPIMPFDGVNNSAQADGLADGASFSVAVQGLNANGQVLAFGCVTGVTIIGGQDTTVNVPLIDMPLQYKGEYQVVNRFDLTDMLSNSGVPALATVDQVLNIIGIIGNANGDRGDQIISLFCDLVSVGQGICDAVQLVGGRVIDNLIDQYVPAEILNVFNIIGDIYSIVSDLTIVGEMDFNPDSTDPNTLQTNNNWQKFQFQWRNNCQHPDPNNPDPNDCVKQFNIGADGAAQDPIAGLFNASVCDVSADAASRPASCPPTLTVTQIQIPEHSFDVHYGTILLAVAEEWIIPAVLSATSGNHVDGPVTMSDLLQQLLPCETIDNAIGAGSTFCEQVLVSALSDLITQQLSRLDLEVNQFTLAGSVEPVDSDADLNIDQLNNGLWTGRVAFTAGNPIPFRGCFSGCLKHFDENHRLIDCPAVAAPCEILPAQ